ncbi:MAG: glycine cleavage system aminomethyltransferase GcvT [Christensenellales bacterium]|mgnify:CR=1 FL=1|jgi:aminomethyltransferase
MCKKTPLYDEHVTHGGKMVEFAGYLLPVQYPHGIIKEHLAVRQTCGLFDVSHMGEIIIKGKQALENLQNLFCNNMEGMAIGRARYSPMLNEQGGMVDDVLVYRIGEDEYWIIANAANKDKDVSWIKAHLFGEVQLIDASDKIAQLALQGPRSRDILCQLMNEEDIPAKNYTFTNHVKVAGVECLVSRTGYTGELGYELYMRGEDAVRVMRKLLEAGEPHGLILCGLGARDTLRLEAGMPLYGHEMGDEITPLESGLAFFVKLDKPGFIGLEALKEKGKPKRIRVGLEVVGKGIVRENCPLYLGDRQVGQSTSGTMSPLTKKAIAMGLVDVQASAIGTQMEADVRGRRLPVVVVEMPFYKRSK